MRLRTRAAVAPRVRHGADHAIVFGAHITRECVDAASAGASDQTSEQRAADTTPLKSVLYDNRDLGGIVRVSHVLSDATHNSQLRRKELTQL